MFKVNNKNTDGVFVVNFEHISRVFLVILLLILNKKFFARVWVV